MYSKTPGLTDLEEEKAKEVYKKAVEILKEEEPAVYMKSLMLSGIGGGLGVLCGSLVKDIVFKIPGLNTKAFIILAFFAIVGGLAGGLFVASRMEKKIQARIPRAREALNL